MMQIYSGIYQSSLLQKERGVVHGFSSRKHHDARVPANESRILNAIGASAFHLVGVKQVHGSDVVIAHGASSRIMGQADAIVSPERGVLLEVHVADCVPVLLYDPVSKVAGAVHAGWRGTQKEVVRRALDAMGEQGARAGNIIAVIGPHIGACCYTVSGERAKLFGPDAAEKDRVWHLDLGAANRRQLMASGIREANIDEVTDCTSCRNDLLYSYRKDTKETFGEIIGVIGIRGI